MGLASDRVPAVMIVEMIPDLSTEHYAEDLGSVLGVSGDYLQKLKSGRYNTVAFDFADRLVCHFDGPDFWHRPDIEDLYNSLDLSETCQAPGCKRTFKSRCSGGARRLYCSNRCKRRALGQRKGIPPKVIVEMVGNRYVEKCRRGHELTPENTKPKSGGGRQCRECFNESQRRRYAARKAA